MSLQANIKTIGGFNLTHTSINSTHINATLISKWASIKTRLKYSRVKTDYY